MEPRDGGLSIISSLQPYKHISYLTTYICLNFLPVPSGPLVYGWNGKGQLINLVCPLPSSPRLCPSSGQTDDQHCCDETPSQLGTVHLDLSSCLDSKVSTPMTSWTRSCSYCSGLAFQSPLYKGSNVPWPVTVRGQVVL